MPPPNPTLTGLRIPVSRIFQVSSFTFAAAPDFSRFPIFYDDPSLFFMGAFNGYLGPGGLTPGGTAIPTAPGQWQFSAQDRSDFINRWIDGVFAGVVFDVTYENGVVKTFPIRDLVFHADDTPGFWRGLEIQHFLRNGRTRIDLFHTLCAVPAPNNSPLSLAERWDQWSRDREPIIRFVYRGQHIDAQIPIFNRLTGFTIEARVAGEQVIMNGRSEVYQRPDLFPEFLMMTRMRAEYIGNNWVGGNVPAGVREDIVADINARTLRGVEVVLPAVPVAGRGVHNVVAGATGDGAQGILNRENSDRFLRDGRLQTARVTFVATNGIEAGTRAMNARFNIGVINYANE